jgi:hypothetical protein
MKRLEVFIIVYSVISCCCSLSVIGTILFFRKMQRGKFMPIILYMSLADFFLNLTSSFGFPDDGSPLCWIQGVFATFFTLSGWFWTTLLAYRVYSMVRYGGCNLTQQQMHMVGWGIPLLLTALPLTTTNYGTSPDSNQWCLFKQRGNNPGWLMPFWSYLTFFIWLFLCVGLMITWQIIIMRKFKDSSMKDVIRRTYDKVYLYPVVMIGCWMLNIFCDDIAQGNPKLNALSMVVAISDGVLSALIFMVKSEEAQRRWYNYFFPPKTDNFNEIMEPRLDFEVDDEEAVEITDYGNSIATKPSDMGVRDSSMVCNPVMRGTM